jgi:hypothetical protein
MSTGNRREWREICEEIVRERDTDRSNALMEELLEVLDARARASEAQPSPRAARDSRGPLS